VARTAGLLLGRLQRYVSDVKSDINREIQLDELKKLQSEIRDSARSVEQSLTSGVQEVRQTAQSVSESLTPTAVPAQPASPGDAQAPAAAPPVAVPAEQPKSTP